MTITMTKKYMLVCWGFSYIFDNLNNIFNFLDQRKDLTDKIKRIVEIEEETVLGPIYNIEIHGDLNEWRQKL